MKPEKWVESQLAAALDALEASGAAALAGDPRAHLAVVALALAAVLASILRGVWKKKKKAEAARRERLARWEARAREKEERAEKKRRRRVDASGAKEAVVVTDRAVVSTRRTLTTRNDDPGEPTRGAGVLGATRNDGDVKVTRGSKQPYMARLARAAARAAVDDDGWSYEREWEEEQAWRREAALLDRKAFEWTPTQLTALKRAIRAIRPDAHPTRESRFRAIAAAVSSDASAAGPEKTWTACAAKFVALRDEALERRRLAHDEARREMRHAKASDITASLGFDDEREHDDEYDDHDDHEDDDEEEEEEEGVYGSDVDDEDLMPVELTPARAGTLVELVGVQSTGVAAVRAAALALTVRCDRCEARQDVTLSGCHASGAAATLWCGGCSDILRASLRPCLVLPGARSESASSTPGTHALAYVDLENCEVADVLPSAIRAGCDACQSRGTQVIRAPLARGRAVRDGCRACGAGMSLIARDVAVTRITASASVVSKPAAKKNSRVGARGEEEEDLGSRLRRHRAASRPGDGPAIREGTALPDLGRCAHFRRSLRWIRFPCCGKAFPCAVCHEKSDCPAASVGVWANRMICGQCSREQPFSPDAPCRGCGFKMGRGGSKSHWNAGGGMRDPSRLSKKDSRHKDASWDKRKTVSRKKAAAGGNPGGSKGGNKYQGNRNR